MSEKLKVKRLDEDAKLPVRGSARAAGYDLFSVEEVTILPRSRKRIKTGISVQAPPNTMISIRTRSSIASMGVDTCGGVVDADYTGEIGVILHNTGPFDYRISKGDKIAQFIVQPILTPDVEEVSELDKTDRGDKGFGSTGK